MTYLCNEIYLLLLKYMHLYKFLQFQGANLKVYILEDTEVRMGQDHGRKYGVTNVLSKSTEYDCLHEMVMPEKFIMKTKASVNKCLLLKNYAIKEDGNIRISDYTTVSIYIQSISSLIVNFYSHLK